MKCRLTLSLFLCICLWGAAGSQIVFGQQSEGPFTLVLRGTPMVQALEELARLTEIDLVYASELVAGKHVYCAGRGRSAESLLQCILAGSGLDYVRTSSGTYVLIESLQELPRHGNLAGSVVDRDTGEPLPYANVLLAYAGAGTTTDEAGLFSFSSVLSGPHRIVVTYVGYETAVDSVWVEGGDRKRVQIALQPREVAMAPIVITGLEQRLPSGGLGTGTLEGRRLNALHEGGTPDVARGAALLTGVAVQQPLADLHIQGGASGEHLTLLDGVPIRDPVSLGRHLGAFSPLAVDRLTVHKAGFGADLGSHLSGVIAVEQEVAPPEPRHVVLHADPVSFNGKVQGRFAFSEEVRGAATAALRTSLWGLYRDAGIETLLQRWTAVDPALASIWIRENVNAASLVFEQHRPTIGFSDFHAAVRLHLSPFRSLHASAYHARNGIESEMTALNADSPSDPDQLILGEDDYQWTNWAAQVRHNWLLGARSAGMVQLQGGWHMSHYYYLSLHAPTPPLSQPEELEQAAAALRPELATAHGSGERNQIRELALKAELSHSFSPRHHAEFALKAAHADSRFRFGNQFIAPIIHDASAWELSGYVKDRLALGLQTTLEPSLRLTYLPVRQTVYAEPRLAVRYDGTQSPLGGYALRLAGGLYRQFTNQFELTSSGSSSAVPAIRFWLPVDRSLAPPRVYHAAADVLLTPGLDWTVSLEAYYKWQPRLLTLDYAALLADHAFEYPAPDPVRLRQDAFISPARGRALGGSVRVQRDGERLSHTVSYSFSHAVRRIPSRFDGRFEPAPWNEPHRLLFDGEAAITPRLSAGLNGQAIWGRRWALRRAYYDYLALREDPAAFEGFDLDDPSEQKLSPYYRLDAGLTYERAYGRATIQVRAYLINVLGRQNVYDWSLEQSESGFATVARTLPGRYPVLSLRLGY